MVGKPSGVASKELGLLASSEGEIWTSRSSMKSGSSHHLVAATEETPRRGIQTNRARQKQRRCGQGRTNAGCIRFRLGPGTQIHPTEQKTNPGVYVSAKCIDLVRHPQHASGKKKKKQRVWCNQLVGVLPFRFPPNE